MDWLVGLMLWWTLCVQQHGIRGLSVISRHSPSLCGEANLGDILLSPIFQVAIVICLMIGTRVGLISCSAHRSRLLKTRMSSSCTICAPINRKFKIQCKIRRRSILLEERSSSGSVSA